MIPYGKQTIDEQDVREVVRALRSDYLTQGPRALKFEQALAKYTGTKYAVACANGTAALHLAYLATGLKKGDEVIMPPNTFVATANMLAAVGVKPVFVDIRMDSYNIDEKLIERKVTKRTRAIVPVHFAGQPCEMKKIWQLAKKQDLLVIEDAAHALGARYLGKRIGSGKSDMVIFSFHAIKSITTGEGGAVLTNSQRYYEKLLLLRSHGIRKDKRGWNVMTQLGYNYRLTDFQAALGISQLRKLNKFIAKRKQIAHWYQNNLQSLSELILPQEIIGSSSWHLYVIRVKKSSDRDQLAKYLQKQGIGINFHYPAVYSHLYWRKHGYQSVALENMEEYDRTCLTLPIHPGLKQKEVRFISNKIIKHFSK